MMDDASNLNGIYAAFGKVIEGMDILEKMYNELEIAEPEAEEAEAGTGTEETVLSEEAAEEETTDSTEESAGISI